MKTRHALAAGAVAAALVLGGCSLSSTGSTEVGAGSLAQDADLDGVALTVGGKEFTEQLVLCEIAAQALQSAGADVKRRCGISGSNTVRAALESGDIDLYWEYTGTGWLTFLKKKPVADATALYEQLDAADTAEHKIRWLTPAPADNTYAIAAAKQKAAELKVASISDYARLVAAHPEQARMCAASEFLARNDGWPGVERAYGFDLPEKRTAVLAAGAIYNSIAKSKPCEFGEVFATDGRIAALGLTVLDDDKHFFPAYNPAVSVRAGVLHEHPDVEKVLAPVAAALDTATLQSLNAEVDVEGRTAPKVAREWLVSKGFIT